MAVSWIICNWQGFGIQRSPIICVSCRSATGFSISIRFLPIQILPLATVRKKELEQTLRRTDCGKVIAEPKELIFTIVGIPKSCLKKS